MNVPKSKVITIKELKELKFMLNLLENALERSDFDRDTTFCKAVLTRINQHLHDLAEIRNATDDEKHKNLIDQINKLIAYYSRFVQTKCEDWKVSV